MLFKYSVVDLIYVLYIIKKRLLWNLLVLETEEITGSKIW